MLIRSNSQGSDYLSFQPIMAFEADPAALGGGSDSQTTGEISSQGPEETGYSDYAQGILKDVSKEHLPIVEPLLKKWDAGFTRRIQDLHNQYKPYADLGWDEDTTQQMAEVYRVLNEDPMRLYEALANELGVNGEQNEESNFGDVTENLQGLPPEFKQQLEQQQQVITALAQWVMDQDKSTTEAREDEEFGNYLNLLKQEYGEFDEEYVVTKIANGMDGEAAVKSWQNTLESWMSRVNESTDHLPNAMLSSAGGGAVPQQERQRLGDIPEKDIRTLITNVLTQTRDAGM